MQTSTEQAAPAASPREVLASAIAHIQTTRDSFLFAGREHNPYQKGVHDGLTHALTVLALSASGVALAESVQP